MSAAADLQVALDRLLHNQTGLARQIARRHAKSPLAQWVVGLSWKMEKNADQAKAACDAAQDDLRVISSSSRIRLKSPDGTTRYMSTEEIEQRKSQAEADIKQFCK